MANRNHSDWRRRNWIFLTAAALAFAATGTALLRFAPEQGRLVASSPRVGQQSDHIVEAFGRLPLQFEENRGQGPADARFLARGHGFAASFTAQEVLLQLDGGRRAASLPLPCLPLRCASLADKPTALQSDATGQASAPLIRIGWESRGSQTPHGVGASAARVHYLTGNDSAQWTRDVPLYDQVVYSQVQPGMDLVFYGRQQQMEFDLIVSPGAQPESFAMTLDGADSLALTPDGELRVTAAGESFIWKRPEIYQHVAQANYTLGGDNRQRVEIAGSYHLEAGNRVRFAVGDYDHSRPLVIDPVLQYSSYIGGNGSDQIQGIAIDAQGNIYVAGSTSSVNFPTASAFRATKSAGIDMFISKLNPSGTSLVYSTFLGGSGDDVVQRLALGADGSVTVAGYTSSSNFPSVAAAQTTYGGSYDAAVARLNPGGSALIYSTYIGGSGEDAALAVALDSTGAAYITGYTKSANYPTLNPFRNASAGGTDAIVAKFTAAGATVYSTYLGGSGADYGLGIAVDATGIAVLAGSTTSPNLPTAGAFQSTLAAGTCSDAGNTFPCGDGFVARLAASGNTVSALSYLGGTGDEQVNALTLDGSGAIYLTGYTTSTNFPTRTPLQAAAGGLRDAFVTKLAANAGSLVFSTYLGGLVDDTGTAIAVDSAGIVYVTGSTESGNFPTVNPLQARASTDAFVSRLNAAGTAMSYSTFLGGSDFDQALAIAVDNNGVAYVAGWTNSDDFPVRTPLQSVLGGGTCGTAPLQYICEDGFVARVAHQPGLFVGGMVNGASFAAGAPVAAGSIVSAFGSDLTTANFAAAAVPLPTNLGGLSVTMNGTPAPLFFAGSGQVNLQVPWEVAGQNTATIVASQNGVPVSQTTVALAAARPGIFSTNSQGSGQGAILIANTADLVAPANAIPGRTSRPATRGETITIFATGLGAVSNRPATGAAGPGGPLALTAATPTVTIGGVNATVSFSGLAPGFVGLYQVNVAVPLTAPQNGAVPVVLSVGGVASNTVTIAVQ